MKFRNRILALILLLALFFSLPACKFDVEDDEESDTQKNSEHSSERDTSSESDSSSDFDFSSDTTSDTEDPDPSDSSDESDFPSEDNNAGLPLIDLPVFKTPVSRLGADAARYLSSSSSTTIGQIVSSRFPANTPYTDARDTAQFRALRLDKPKPVSIELTLYPDNLPAGTDILSAALELSRAKDFSEEVQNYLIDLTDMSDTTVEIYNLESDTQFYFRVILELTDEDPYVSKTGSFRTADEPRLMYIDGLYNVRDIGGWKGLDGQRIKQGVVFRGTQLDLATDGNTETFEITEEGLLELKKLGISTDIDLRNSNAHMSPIIGADYHNFRVSSYNLSSLYVDALRLFANKGNNAFYVHCTYGADRTGTLFILLEALLGVSEEDIIRDYELTGLMFASVTRDNQAKGKNGIDKVFRVLENYRNDPDDTLADAAAAYCRAFGMTDAEIAAIRENLLEPLA